jgi:peptide deformylase
MPVRPIVRLGHPALRTPARPVAEARLSDPQLQTLIDDMFETMLESGGVGLAAPQLGLELQVFVYAAVDPDAAAVVAGEGEQPELKVLINPALDPGPGELVYDWEGCLSIPDLRGLVPRHPAARLPRRGLRGAHRPARVRSSQRRRLPRSHARPALPGLRRRVGRIPHRGR